MTAIRRGVALCTRYSHMADRLLTTAEMVERTGFSASWFLTHRKNGTGPAFHRVGAGIGGSIRYRWDDWLAYVDANRVEPRDSFEKGGTDDS